MSVIKRLLSCLNYSATQSDITNPPEIVKNNYK